MELKKGAAVELSITDLAFGGEGVAKIKTAEGELAVFVAECVPGDRVRARFTKIKKQYAQARLEVVITPSPQRTPARCKHFGVCGGCSLQMLDYADQLKWKQKMVADALHHIGGFRGVEIEPVAGCASPWFYRNKMEYSFGADGRLGLHPGKNYREVFDLEECFLQSPASVEIALAVAAWAREKNLPGFDAVSGRGFLKNLVVREGKNTGECLVNLITAGEEFPLQQEFARAMTKRFPQITSLYRTAVTVRRGHRTAVKEFLLFGKLALTETLTVQGFTLTFDIHPLAFFQPNTKQAEILYGKILEFAGSGAGRAALDFFCGTGTIGMFLAKAGFRATGIELNPEAIENARNNARANSIENIRFFCGDVERAMANPPLAGEAISLLITDPPRAGIAQKSLEKIIALKIPQWIYVSCNPATLARDLQIICRNGYRLNRIQPVDMFPHTSHIEIVAQLTYL